MEETKDELELRLLRRVESLLKENIALKKELDKRHEGSYCAGCGAAPGDRHALSCHLASQLLKGSD